MLSPGFPEVLPGCTSDSAMACPLSSSLGFGTKVSTATAGISVAAWFRRLFGSVKPTAGGSADQIIFMLTSSEEMSTDKK
jgi:hypothetical protein